MRGRAVEAFKARDLKLDRIEHDLTQLLVGRTIVSVKADPHSENCMAANVLRLTFDDGSHAVIEGGYDADEMLFACNEYVETLTVKVGNRA